MPLAWHRSHSTAVSTATLFGDAGRAFAEIQPHPKQRVRSRARTRPTGPAAAGSAAEERLEHVAQATKATESTCRRGGVLHGSPPRSTMRRFSGSDSTS